MTTVSVPEERAKQGVKIAANTRTTIQVQTASLDLLVGGPYPDHPYGHTALRVTTKSADRIYDYGRYGLTWGVGKSEGQGILRVWKSFDAYIAGENRLGRVTTGFLYEVGEAKANEVIQFFDAKIAGKKPLDVTPNMQSFLIEDYYALGPNCTTLSVAATKTAIPDLDRDWSQYQKGRGLTFMEKSLVTARGWPKYIFMPADLQTMLESPSARKPKRIKTFGGKS